MLCSDGLSSMVDDRAILDIVERNRTSLERAARALVDAANRGGGEDNITVVAVRDRRPRRGRAATPARRSEAGAVAGRRGRPCPASTRCRSSDDRRCSRTRRRDDRAPDPRRARGARRAGARGAASRGRAIVAGSIAAVVVLAALVVWSLSRSYFVGAQPDGHVAVYQGFPWNIVGSVRLYRVRYESPVLAGQLSQSRAPPPLRPRPAQLRGGAALREAVRGRGRAVGTPADEASR